MVVTVCDKSGCHGMRVSDLIDYIEHKWKHDIINMLFNDRDVHHILVMSILLMR
jgi:hypothetical protein